MHPPASLFIPRLFLAAFHRVITHPRQVVVWSAVSGDAEAHLKAHNGPVKGAVWDPVGRFLASQGDDKRVLIWAVDTWTLHAVIEEPFEGMGIMSTLFLRPAWSADGSGLVLAHARDSGLDVATCVDRETFSKARHFVGHKKPVTCCREWAILPIRTCSFFFVVSVSRAAAAFILLS